MSAGRFELPIDSGVVARYVGIATFMRAPRIDDLARVDVGLIGVPFDLGLAYRPGARHGPAAVREASRLIRRINPTTGVFPFELCQVADVGDVVTHPLDLLAGIDAIAAHTRTLREHDVRPVAMGGDHAITLPILRGLFDGTPFGLVQIDSHADTLDEFYGTKINHATSFRRATEEGLIDPRRVVQVGLRGTQWSRNDIAFSLDAGMRCIAYDEYEAIGRANVIAEIKRVVGDGPTYVSFDVDGLDPVYAPGTAVPEPGGLSMRDAQMILRALTGLDIVGGDVVEVSPPLDPTGITAIHAANLMFEILCLVATAKAG
ncbi:MAG TPA: agmatinase [Thermomicrobiales bacterium]|jgi:guanidinopropionase